MHTDPGLLARLDSAGALLFDCDGTLADTMPLHYTAWKRVLEPLGVRFREEHYFSLAGVPTREILAILAREQGIALDIDELLPRKESYYLESAHATRAIESVVGIARRHAPAKPMAVVSGGVRTAVLRTLEIIAVSGLFRTVVTAEDTARGKPHPDPYLLAAERLGVAPSRCIVFEDGEPGIESGRAAGMHVVDVRGWI